MATNLDEVIEFLGIVSDQGLLNENTVIARRTACNKFFDILDANQRTVEYVRDNLGVIKTRFSNLNKEVRGNTVDEYARRVQLVINDFISWQTDRAAWERSVSSRQSARSTNDGEKHTRATKTGKAKPQSQGNGNEEKQTSGNKDSRAVTFPIRPDFEVEITIPRNGLSVTELKKLVYFLLPYAQDWEPTDSPRTVFAMLERDEDLVQ